MNERFQPVRGREGTISIMPITNGQIYFTTDTGKIFVDLENERVLMGNSGVALFYGYDPNPRQDEENESIFYLELSAIEGYENIHDDDLILNQDGCFYKASEIDSSEDTVECVRLSVSGSGGGGGSGATSSIKIRGTSLEHSTLVNGQAATVNITAISATDEDGVPEDTRMTVVWAMRAEGATAPYLNGSFEVENNVPKEFDIGSRLRENAHTILTFYASGVNSGQTKKTLQYDITTVDLTLTANEKFNNLTLQSDANDVTFYCNVTGTIKKILYFKLDGEVINTQILDTRTSGECYTTLSKTDTRLYHGYHTLEIELYSYDNDIQGMGPAPLVYEFPFRKIGNDYLTPIIWIGSYKDIYYSYDKIQIPYMVYDPMAPNNTHVEFYKGSEWLEAKSTSFDAEKATSFKIFEINDATVDADNLYYIYCGDASRNISFTCITDTSRDMNIIPTNLLFSLDAAGRSNNESATNRSKLYSVIKHTANNIVTSVDTETYFDCFENFNWYNNGWILDENNDTCLRISNGARLSIPIGPLDLNTGAAGSQSCTFEFEFKVKNISNYNKLIKEITRYKGDDNAFVAFEAQTEYENYDAWLSAFDNFEVPVLDGQGNPTGETEIAHMQNCYYYNLTMPDGEPEFNFVYKKINLSSVCCSYYNNGVGLCLGPQDGFFTDGTDTVSVKYVEDKVMNLSIVFSFSKKLIFIYLNGVLTGVSKITPNEKVSIQTDKIVFSSDYCDFDLYKFRVYNSDLSVTDIDLNYAVDHKDILIYDQTKIALNNPNLGEYQLSYAQMLEYNANHPDDYLMPYVVFDSSEASLGDALPYTKSIPTNGVKIEFVNVPLERAYETGELNDLADADGVSVAEYYAHHCPSFTSVGGDSMWTEISVQGTSSQYYPRRNYKMKFKDDDDVVHMYMNRGPFVDAYKTVVPALAEDQSNQAEIDEAKARIESTHLKDGFFFNQYEFGTNKFTMKIDYMESSGTYNMGFANFVTNAYTKHPINDLNNAGAYEVAVDEYQTASSFTEGAEYVYINYKGNKKVASEEGFEITAENFAEGPNFFITDESKKLSPANNVWKTAVTTYEPTTIDNPGSYRTNVQGFPVMVFHKKSDGSYLFIGRYNMLLDKGSDECYGFKPAKTVLAAFNKHKTMRKTAECWEMEDNARGYCSFRDPLKRRTLSFSYPETDITSSLYYAGERGNSKVSRREDGTYDKHGCPIVADSFEYRYHTNKDLLDYLYDPSSMTEAEVAEVQADFGKEGDLLDPATRNNLLFKNYANLEKLCQWVWSTCTDGLPTEAERQAGTKTAERIKVAQKCADVEFDSSKTYYNDSTCNYEAHVTPIVYDENATYYYDKNGLIVAPGSEVTANTYTNFFVAVDENTYEANKFYELVDTTVTYNNVAYEWDTVEYRQAKFRAEFTQHFDLEYSLVYFLMTEIFECYDSRGKNCMLASWGPQVSGGEYIWYPIFYDIDTQLGINNTGIPSFEYYVNVSEEGCFSTNESVLWTNLYACFRTEIVSKYQQLRGANGGITNVNTKKVTTPLIGKTTGSATTSSDGLVKAVEHIEKWYLADPVECDQINMRGARPLIMLNLDEYYKYISILNGKIGYQNRTGGIVNDSGGTYFYALQGDRSLSRQQFLNNRLEFMDSYFVFGSYARQGDAIWGRIVANNPSAISDNMVDDTSRGPEGTEFTHNGQNYVVSEYYQKDGQGNIIYDPDTKYPIKRNYLDADIDIFLKPYQRAYVSVGGDNEATGSKNMYNGQYAIRMSLPGDLPVTRRSSPGYGEQLFYIYGARALQDIGDASLLYWTEFKAENSPKLQTILLGNDHPNFYNNSLNLPAFYASAEDSPGKPMLKKVNLTRVQMKASEGASITLDLTSSEKLQEFRALHSNLAGVSFADGVALDTLYLPESITEIRLIEARKLNNIITDSSDIEPTVSNYTTWTPEKGLYIAGLTDLTSETIGSGQTSINTLNIQGGSLGYNSYDLLKKLYTIKTRTGANLKVNLTDVDWKPFVQIDEGYEYNELESSLYFIDNGHYQLVPYEYTNRNSWELSILNKELYKKVNEIPNTIVDFKMLKDLAEQSNFMNTNNFNNEIPTIAGTIYINNANGGFNQNAGTGRVEESYIKNTLQGWYPNLDFFFTNVEKAFSAKFVQIVDEDTGELNVLGTQKVSISRYGNGAGVVWFDDPFETYNTEKNHFDFIGWKTYTINGDAIIYLNKTTEEYEALSEREKSIYIAEYGEENIFTKDDWADREKSHFVRDENENLVLDYVFYAMHEVHKHTITFKNIDSEETVLQTDYIPYGDYLRTPDLYPSIDDSQLDFDKTYAFIGFAMNKNAITPTNLDKTLCTDDLTFYALYEERSVYDNILDEKYLTFTLENYNEADSGTSQYNVEGGYIVSIAPNVSLSGKITLPIYWEGKDSRPAGPITKIGNFNTGGRGVGITHIFFQRESNEHKNLVRQINASAFQSCDGLRYFEVPSNLRQIQATAFENCPNLVTGDFSAKVYKIGLRAFSVCFSNSPSDYITVTLGGDLKILATNGPTFSYNSGKIQTLTIGSPDNPSNLTTAPSQISVQNWETEVGEVIIYCTNDRYDYFYGLEMNYAFGSAPVQINTV